MFRQLRSAEEALEALLQRCPPVGRTEVISLEEAADRVICENIFSQADLPSFNRAAMDGFAVRSSGTRGACPQAPIYLEPIRSCRKVSTGMAVPEGFDAVVMTEDTVLRRDQVEVRVEVHPFKNVSRIGEDLAAGDRVFEEGHKLRPPDIALLAALGVKEVAVYVRPRVAIIPTGGELVVAGSRTLEHGEAYEINGIMAQLYVEKWGGTADRQGIVPDDPDKIRGAVESRLNADMIVPIGGTSVGERDFAPSVLEDMGELLVHGVRIQPGKPTAFGLVGRTPVVCLPGYPVAALVGLYLFVRPALKKLAHLDAALPKTFARLARKIASREGYMSIVRVALQGGDAMPIMTSGAGILSSVGRADGFVIVPEELEGIEAGERVEVVLIE